MKKLAAYTSIATCMMLAPGFAANEGTAVGVNPDAVSRAASADRVLVVGADVSVGETIVTGPSGTVQLLFDDQTRLVVGPRSTLQIEAYLLNGSGADKFAVNALAGTFRFISGTSPKSAYSIDTPTASIAVRGTKFDVTVGNDRTYTLLYEGALTQCQGSACIDLQSRCEIGVVGSGLAKVWSTAAGDRNEIIGYFPLPNIQSAFLRDFRVAGAQACLAPTSTSTKSIVDGPTNSSNTQPTPTPTPTPPPPGNNNQFRILQ